MIKDVSKDGSERTLQQLKNVRLKMEKVQLYLAGHISDKLNKSHNNFHMFKILEHKCNIK